MKRLSLVALVLAVVAAAVGIWYLSRAARLGPEPVIPLEAEAAARAERSSYDYEKPAKGGIYAGTVLDSDDHPIQGAHVLLVSYATGGPDMLTQGSGADADPDELRDVPVVGRLTVGGEGITDADGRFRIAADAQSTITRVLAYHPRYFLDVVEVKKPREDIVLHLVRGGRVIGTVVDDKTGAPVAGAVVDIYLQQKVAKVPDQVGTYGTFKRKRYRTSWLASLGRFIGEELGPRIWDVVDSHSDTLRTRTDANGHFELGPLGDSVQLEFVITHPDYTWRDFDTDDGKHTPKRLVVEPGETVERTFRLKRGKHVAGQVVDEDGKGIPDVFVKVQSISAYYRHWWYKHKWRRARTDFEGRFRVDGLAIGAQQVIFQHPSFGEKVVSVQAGTDDLTVVADRFGALAGTLEGVARSGIRRRITVLLESLEENPAAGRQQRRTVALEKTNQFLVKRIPPGKYRAWVQAGKESSAPVEVTIEGLQTNQATFEIGAGGTIEARVIDADGTLLDPASARLLVVEDGKEKALGTFVAREGELAIDGVAPGSYRLMVSAPGKISERTEPFDVTAGRVTHVGVVELEAYAYLRFGVPVNDLGRPARLTEDLIVEIRLENEKAFHRVDKLGALLPVRPGSIAVRAHSGSLSFEGTVQVRGGETKPVEIVFPNAR